MTQTPAVRIGGQQTACGDVRLRTRVHELARLPLLDLISIYNELAGKSDGSIQAPAAMTGDRDRLIAAIRELEDPR